MPQSRPKPNRKLETFQQYRIIRSECYRALMRSVDTPYAPRAYAIHEIASDLVSEFQADPDGHIEQLDRLEMFPLSAFICELIARDLA